MNGKDYVPAAGALASAALIASCCLGPVLFLAFGISIGALGGLSALEPYRPLFIAAGFGSWGYGFLRLYRPRPGTAASDPCGPGCERPSRWARRLLWVGLAILVLATVLPNVASYYVG
jgi:mercuric ion transport protein